MNGIASLRFKTVRLRATFKNDVYNTYGIFCATYISTPQGWRRVYTVPLSFFVPGSISAHYTHDVIALAAFGFDTDSTRATEDRPSVSFQAMRMITTAFMKLAMDPLAM